jgi:hypothetical protein
MLTIQSEQLDALLTSNRDACSELGIAGDPVTLNAIPGAFSGHVRMLGHFQG